MKTLSSLITELSLIGLLNLCSAANSYSSTNPKLFTMKNDTTTYFQIKGKIAIANNSANDNYTLEVLYYNSTVSFLSIENDKPFTLLVKKDSPYTLKVSRKGFVSRSICINTNINESEDLNTPYSFAIETDLIGIAQAMRMDEEVLGMPAALISYNKDIKDFDYNKNYSAFVHERVFPKAID